MTSDEGLYLIQPAEDPDGDTSAKEQHPSSGPPAVQAVTAFLVTVDAEGSWTAHLDPNTWGNLAILRAPGSHDVLAACGVLTADFSARMAAQVTINAQMQAAAQIAQQQESLRIQQALSNGRYPFRGGGS